MDRLRLSDRTRLLNSVFRRTAEQAAAVVRMDSAANVFIVAHFETPSRRIPVARVVAGEVDAGVVYATDAVAAGDAVQSVELPGAGQQAPATRSPDARPLGARGVGDS